ncbi:MAG: hypothetical protein QOC62_6524 [Mycobacterium sp.]|jgi:hypothetical protein|nr:hypothetical protein [Mycobacterium sp.]
MREMVAQVIVERQRDRERLAAAPGGDGGRKIQQLHEPVVTPHMGKLAREPCPRDRRDELPLEVSVAVSDVMIEQDKPSPTIRAHHGAQQRSPQERLERLECRANPHTDVFMRSPY